MLYAFFPLEKAIHYLQYLLVCKQIQYSHLLILRQGTFQPIFNEFCHYLRIFFIIPNLIQNFVIDIQFTLILFNRVMKISTERSKTSRKSILTHFASITVWKHVFINTSKCHLEAHAHRFDRWIVRYYKWRRTQPDMLTFETSWKRDFGANNLNRLFYYESLNELNFDFQRNK